MFVNVMMLCTEKCAFRGPMGALMFSKKAKVFILPSFALLVGHFDLAVVAGEACRTGTVMSSFGYNSSLGHDSCRRLPNVKYCYLQMHTIFLNFFSI